MVPKPILPGTHLLSPGSTCSHIGASSGPPVSYSKHPKQGTYAETFVLIALAQCSGASYAV